MSIHTPADRLHTPADRHLYAWRVCRLVSADPREVEPLDGLDNLPEPLAQAICLALEEAKPGCYFIEGRLPEGFHGG